jgi:hypothetical protein
MMHGPEKSDSPIVAVKPANKAGKPEAEWVEPRGGTKGNHAPTLHAADCVLQPACPRGKSVYGKCCRLEPKVGAVCLNRARTDLCGGTQ